MNADDALKDVTAWYAEHRRFMNEEELGQIVAKHTNNDEEAEQLIHFLASDVGKRWLTVHLQQRKEELGLQSKEPRYDVDFAQRLQGELTKELREPFGGLLAAGRFPKRDEAIQKLGKVTVAEVRDNGDLTVRSAGKLYVVTTEGQTFEQTASFLKSRKSYLRERRPDWAEEFEGIGGRFNRDGTVTLYHATTKDKAEQILKEGVLRRPADAPDYYGVYFSSSPSVAEDYGDGTLIRVRVKASDLHPDDVFPGRRMDFNVPTTGGLYKPAAIESYAIEGYAKPAISQGILDQGQELAVQLGNGVRCDGPYMKGEKPVGFFMTDVAVTGTTFFCKDLEGCKERLIVKRKQFGARPPEFLVLTKDEINLLSLSRAQIVDMDLSAKYDWARKLGYKGDFELLTKKDVPIIESYILDARKDALLRLAGKRYLKEGSKEPWQMTRSEYLAPFEKAYREASEEWDRVYHSHIPDSLVAAANKKFQSPSARWSGEAWDAENALQEAQQAWSNDPRHDELDRERTRADRKEQTARSAHEKAVRQALREGLPVPAEVLKDYPNMVVRKRPASYLVETGDPETCEMLAPQYWDLLPLLNSVPMSYSLLVEPEAKGRKIDEILQRLKEGVESISSSANFREFLITMGKFHDYSIGNQILIMIQRRNATRVAGFTTWKELGRFVRAGEKGIAILAPCMPPKRKPSETEEEGEEQELQPRPMYFKVVYVFDVSQTDGKPLPEVEVPALTGEANEELFGKVLAHDKAQGLKVSFESKPDQNPEIKGYYVGKSVWVRPEESRAQQLKTLIHETAHYYTEGVFMIPRADAETIAESVAFTVGARFGFDSGARSFPYVAVWAQDRKVLDRNLLNIRKISARMIEALE